MKPSKLDVSAKPKQEFSDRVYKFVDEYLVDMNATQAAIRAGYSANCAKEQGYRLLTNAHLMELITNRMNDRKERTEITQDMVLRRWWQIATADPRNLIEYRRCACRYCYGIGNQYQWIDEKEFIKATSDEKKPPEDTTNAGGYGFNPTLDPNADCPRCGGRGTGEVSAHDTRTLDEQSALLYAGVKVSKDGLEIKMQDQGKALENVARHLGMFIDKVEHSGAVDNQVTIISDYDKIRKSIQDNIKKRKKK